jgi:hypothetical protein
MENDAWTPVAVRLFSFTVLPVLLAALHVQIDAGAKCRLLTVEVLSGPPHGDSSPPAWDMVRSWMARVSCNISVAIDIS